MHSSLTDVQPVAWASGHRYLSKRWTVGLLVHTPVARSALELPLKGLPNKSSQHNHSIKSDRVYCNRTGGVVNPLYPASGATGGPRGHRQRGFKLASAAVRVTV